MRAWRSSSHWSSRWACSVAEPTAFSKDMSPGWRRVVGRVVGALILVCAVAAVVVTIWQWEKRAETNDATVRANFIGMAPDVNGRIIDLPIRDDQQVQRGELL